VKRTDFFTDGAIGACVWAVEDWALLLKVQGVFSAVFHTNAAIVTQIGVDFRVSIRVHSNP
jgi:hypothetical protein